MFFQKDIRRSSNIFHWSLFFYIIYLVTFETNRHAQWEVEGTHEFNALPASFTNYLIFGLM
jgi:hypothetical protein